MYIYISKLICYTYVATYVAFGKFTYNIKVRASN